jgi:hypothetical protein
MESMFCLGDADCPSNRVCYDLSVFDHTLVNKTGCFCSTWYGFANTSTLLCDDAFASPTAQWWIVSSGVIIFFITIALVIGAWNILRLIRCSAFTIGATSITLVQVTLGDLLLMGCCIAIILAEYDPLSYFVQANGDKAVGNQFIIYSFLALGYTSSLCSSITIVIVWIDIAHRSAHMSRMHGLNMRKMAIFVTIFEVFFVTAIIIPLVTGLPSYSPLAIFPFCLVVLASYIVGLRLITQVIEKVTKDIEKNKDDDKGKKFRNVMREVKLTAAFLIFALMLIMISGALCFHYAAVVNWKTACGHPLRQESVPVLVVAFQSLTFSYLIATFVIHWNLNRSVTRIIRRKTSSQGGVAAVAAGEEANVT